MQKEFKKNKKKAEIAGQVFMYLMAAIIFALVTLYGYKSISKLTAESKNIQMIEFREDLQSRFRAIAPTRNIERAVFQPPSSVKEVCFVDMFYEPSRSPNTFGICDPNDKKNYRPLVCDAWRDNVSNVILQPLSDVEIKVGALEFEGSGVYFCANVIQGKLTLKLEGKGNKVKVSAIQ